MGIERMLAELTMFGFRLRRGRAKDAEAKARMDKADADELANEEAQLSSATD